MAETLVVCAACGAEKDLPLGRCPACKLVPQGEAREVAMICSTRVLGVDALREAQARIRRGEPVRPTEALRARARALLHGAPMAPARLTTGQLVALAAGNLLLTPLLGYAVAWRHHSEGGPATRQALLVTVPISLLLFAALVMWRLR